MQNNCTIAHRTNLFLCRFLPGGWVGWSGPIGFRTCNSISCGNLFFLSSFISASHPLVIMSLHVRDKTLRDFPAEGQNQCLDTRTSLAYCGALNYLSVVELPPPFPLPLSISHWKCAGCVCAKICASTRFADAARQEQDRSIN